MIFSNKKKKIGTILLVAFCLFWWGIFLIGGHVYYINTVFLISLVLTITAQILNLYSRRFKNHNSMGLVVALSTLAYVVMFIGYISEVSGRFKLISFNIIYFTILILIYLVAWCIGINLAKTDKSSKFKFAITLTTVMPSAFIMGILLSKILNVIGSDLLKSYVVFIGIAYINSMIIVDMSKNIFKIKQMNN